MTDRPSPPPSDLLRLLLKSHPWHGVPIGAGSPQIVTVYVEIVPTDTVKYELDKASGYLRVDRPQKFSSVCPSLYGLIPQTYCGDRIGDLCSERTGRRGLKGDGDPLDICVLSERTFSHGDILLQAVPIGGLRMIDGNEADDKIIAVLKDDAAYGRWKDISECTDTLVQRLRHYFLTYKDAPDASPRATEITHVYDAREAHAIIRASHEDYLDKFGDLAERLAHSL
ncbi:MAG TPA: inorganic pyrophosphatase [Candidatus Acidoferrales bacterium]|nr:inorganic pyrophosphatase [Candidatus Acidoferrales bacterium]